MESAQYLKAGQTLWVDRIFSKTVLNAMYSFHGSTAAYMEFWNNSFANSELNLSHRQIWKVFIEESTRMIAAESNQILVLNDNISIEEITQKAYQELCSDGKIALATNHACTECTQPYKQHAEYLTGDDPAAVVNVDENASVPVLTGEFAGDAALDQQRAQQNATNRNIPLVNFVNPLGNPGMCNMIVMDGIVMGIQHCAFENCLQLLYNMHGGVFCHDHDIEYGNKCCVKNCNTEKINGTQACVEHQPDWQRHVQRQTRDNFSGARRVLQRAANENQPWQPQQRSYIQPHDEDADDTSIQSNYFTAARFYCVETICKPCGVVVAWTKFARSESPTNILNFLNKVYPEKDTRPSYVCIDKACLVLRTAIANPIYNDWLDTSRLIVDVYHYKNHRTSDYLCRKWCNPAPLNGSAPNLVVVAQDDHNNPYYKRAFNTQVCIFHIKLVIY